MFCTFFVLINNRKQSMSLWIPLHAYALFYHVLMKCYLSRKKTLNCLKTLEDRKPQTDSLTYSDIRVLNVTYLFLICRFILIVLTIPLLSLFYHKAFTFKCDEKVNNRTVRLVYLIYI